MKLTGQVLGLLAVVALVAGCAGSGPAASATKGLSPSSPIAADTSLPAAPSGPLLAAGQQAGDLLVWLSSAPEQPVVGNAQIHTTVLGRDGQPVSDARVTYDADMTNMSHGLYQVAAEPSVAGQYAGQVHFSMAGPWRIITVIERPGQPPVRLLFEFRVKNG